MQHSGVQLKVRLSLASNEAIRELVASGMGLSVLSRYALSENSENEGLALLDVEGFPLTQPWSVVHLRSKVLSLPAQAFLYELLQTGVNRPIPVKKSDKP
jgi:DNA-binding transcriptional LysR family regulator